MSVYKNDDPENVKVALASVVNQTLPPQEIIVIIDGPVDAEIENVINFCQHFNGNFIVKKNVENLGLAKSLNIGLRLATTNIIARMDSDDYSLPERFERQSKILSENPSISLVGGWYLQFDEKMKVVTSDRKVPEFMPNITRFSKMRTPINHVTVMFRKEHVLEIGGYCELDGKFEDWWLSLLLIKNGYSIYNIQDYLVHVRGAEDFYLRRGGWQYLKCEIHTLFSMQKRKLLSGKDVISNILLRSFTRLFPNRIRILVYKMIRWF